MSAEDCRRFEGNLVAYLDGELLREDAREMEEHLKDCPRCAEEIEDFRSAKAALKAVPRLRVSESFRDSLEAELASLPFTPRAEEPKKPWFRRKIVYFATSFAACAAFLVAANFWVLAEYVGGDEGVGVSAHAEARRRQLLEIPADAIFESMITGSQLDVSRWLMDGSLYLKGHEDFYSADRCIFAFLPADWGAHLDKRGGVKVVVENGRFLVPEDMRARYLDDADHVTVLRQRKPRRSEIWNTERFRRFRSTPCDFHVRPGASS